MLREIPVRRDCPQCGHVDFTAAVSVIVVWAHGLTTAIPMIPDDEVRICGTGRCRAAHRLVTRAFERHPEGLSAVGQWTRAVIVLDDGDGIEIRNSAGQFLACA